MRIAGVVLALALSLCAGSAWALGVRYPTQAPSRPVRADGKLVIDVWTDRGDGAVYHIGDPIRVHFRTSSDAYVILYNVDTEGRLHLLYPGRRQEPHWVQGGRAYTLPGPGAPYDLEISGPAGVEYIQALVSLEPFQQIPEYFDPDYEDAEPAEGGDWHPSGRIAGDPFVGMERVNRALLPYDCDEQDCFAAAYATYYVERKTPYPRYLCADCHGSYASSRYDPYDTRCSVFEVRIDYDWRWHRRDPFYLTPYWYYFRRPDCAPRFYSYRQRWSSSDGWVRFKDTFGERVLWKKNPGEDPKGGGSSEFHRGSGGGPGGGNPGGGFGRRGTGRNPGAGRGNLSPDPVRVPVERVADEPAPVRFRSKSREVAPPGSGRRGPEGGDRPKVTPAPTPAPAPAEPQSPRHIEGRRQEGSGGDKGEARGRERVKPEPAPKPEKDQGDEARKAPDRGEARQDPPHRDSQPQQGEKPPSPGRGKKDF